MTITPTAPLDLAKLTGLEVMQKLLAGELPPPPFAATTNMLPISVERGRVVFEGVPGPAFLNPLGSVHGGWIATLLDSAMGCAVHTVLPAGQTYTTVEMKVNYLRGVSAKSPPVRCEGTVIHAGSRIALAEGKILDAAGKIVAHATETCLIFEPRAAS